MLPTLTFDEALKDPNHVQAHTLDEWRVVHIMTGAVVWSAPRNPIMIHSGKQQWVYQPALVDELCAEIVNGGSLTMLCDGVRFPPYAQFCRWRRNHPEISQQLEEARRDRAESMRDLALVRAMEAQGKNDTPAKQLQVETLKWLSGVDDPKYKQNAKVDVALTAPTQIIVNTGIDRKNDSTQD